MADTKNVMIRKEMLDWTNDYSRKKIHNLLRIIYENVHELKHKVYRNFTGK